MIDEYRISQLVGELQGVQYRLHSRRKLSAALESNTEDYRRQALLPAPSVTSARDSADMAASVSRITDSEQERLAKEIASLEAERERLLGQLYSEGLQTGRWVGVGERFVYLEKDSAEGEQHTDAGLELHDIPRCHEGYIVPEEDPRLTMSRAQYAEKYEKGKRQFSLTMLTCAAPAVVLHYTGLVSLWLVVLVYFLCLGGCAWFMPEGFRTAGRMLGFGEEFLHPFMEVRPHTGERLETKKRNATPPERQSAKRQSAHVLEPTDTDTGIKEKGES